MPFGVLSDRNGNQVDEFGQMTLLGAGGVYNGTYDGALHYGQVQILLRSDQSSATDGVQVYWSADGTTDHMAEDPFTYTGGIGKLYTLPCLGQYFRIRYTNGSTPQGSFVMQVIFRDMPAGPRFGRIREPFDPEIQAQTTRTRILDILAEENTGNGRETPLGGGATFTGAFKEVRDKSAIQTFCLADQAGTLFVDFSVNGVDVDETKSFAVAANVPLPLIFSGRAQWYRLRYTNGATPQTYFRLQAILHAVPIHPDVLGNMQDAAWSGSGDATLSALLKRLALTPPAAVGAAYTDRSLQITAGNVAEQLMAANLSRRTVCVGNPMENAETIWASPVTTAAVQGLGSVPIFPGGVWEPQVAPTGAISILAPTTGTNVTAWEA